MAVDRPDNQVNFHPPDLYFLRRLDKGPSPYEVLKLASVSCLKMRLRALTLLSTDLLRP